MKTFRRRDFLKALGVTMVALNLPLDQLEQTANKFSAPNQREFMRLTEEQRLESFETLLNTYLADELIRDQLSRPSVFDNIGVGGDIVVPFKRV